LGLAARKANFGDGAGRRPRIYRTAAQCAVVLYP
jgi:hypothetical protein